MNNTADIKLKSSPPTLEDDANVQFNSIRSNSSIGDGDIIWKAVNIRIFG
jgi:hypothetical protein